ncbi:unnamed protein product [Durusdinium trenchii]|uniref:Carboxypeptidase n=1 Tax=Durusdinium trenchii TaxID=1381693 RepID=A0ABP0PD91_9DINO
MDRRQSVHLVIHALFLLVTPFVHAAPEKDRVHHLPGLEGTLLSATYSGYVSVGDSDGRKMYEHYLFFESEGDPKKDPLIMWTNGGPGASSLIGSFTELGPYYLSATSLSTEDYRKTGIPSLFYSPYRWTKLGSLIIRNLPPPVGFSYCDPIGPSGDGRSCGSWNDTKTAKHSRIFMENWMAAFPEYGSHDLFLVGESYAGVYVPMLAREILQQTTHPGLRKQLKGIAVGDGCNCGVSTSGGGCIETGGPFFTVEFFHGHGQFSDKTYAEIQRTCSREELVNGVKSQDCRAALSKMDAERGYSFEYNLYDECYGTDLYGQLPWRSSSWAEIHQRTSWHMDGTPCGGIRALRKWVNTSAVKQALHVAKDAFFFSGDNGVGFTYNLTEPTLIPWYREMVQNQKLRVLIYNGDADPGLNSFYAQNWTTAVGIPEVQSWRPWTRDGKMKMGGYGIWCQNLSLKQHS